MSRNVIRLQVGFTGALWATLSYRKEWKRKENETRR